MRCQAALLHESDVARNDPDPAVGHRPIAYDAGLPKSLIRFSTLHARTPSDPCPAALRARRPSPMIDVYRKKTFSTRACRWEPASFFHRRRPTSCTRLFFGWRRGGDRPAVARRVTAPVTEKWIGLNRYPAARLWALHCWQTELAGVPHGVACGLPADGTRRRMIGKAVPPPSGGIGDASRPARSRRKLRRVSGRRRWVRHDESRRAGHPQTPAR